MIKIIELEGMYALGLMISLINKEEGYTKFLIELKEGKVVIKGEKND